MSFLAGIDNINLYASTFSLDTETLALARNVCDKVKRDTGFTRRSVAPPWEDSVTLGINAAVPLLKTIDKKEIGLLIVATESGLDYGKPISTYIHRLLKLPSSCTNFEIKHACYGGTAALQMALAWQRANPDSNKKALVICTDLARPHLSDLAEFTSGSASVAMIVAKDPKLIVIHPERGCATQEVYDVARPTLDFEWGDPVLSLYSYMDLLELSWMDYAAVQSKNKLSFNDLDYVAYHTPLISLIKNAHNLLLENVNPEDTDRSSFAVMCEPALKYNYEVSNIYSASLYAVLIGLIEHAGHAQSSLNVGCFSYGSGACSEFYTCTILPGGWKYIADHQIMSHLNERSALGIDRYELFMKTNMNTNLIPNHKVYLSEHFEEVANQYAKNDWVILDKIENYYRHYRTV